MGKRFDYEAIEQRIKKRMQDMQEHPEKYQGESEWDKLIDSIGGMQAEIVHEDVFFSTDVPSWNKALDKVAKDIQESYPDCLDENGLPKEDYKVPISMIFAIIAANHDRGMVWN